MGRRVGVIEWKGYCRQKEGDQMTRKEAFEKLEQTVGIYLMSGNADDTYCKEWRETLETLKEEPKTGWISVSERLPEEDGEYLLFGKISKDEDNYIFIGDYDACVEQFGMWEEQFDMHTLGCLGSEFFEYASVLAWQPLPEPYKAESEDKK